MPCSTAHLTSLNLTLSGNRWHIRAGDEIASSWVAMLGEVMSLPLARVPPPQYAEKSWRELRVITNHGSNTAPTGCNQTGPVFCLLPPPRDTTKLVIGMSMIALAIARAELARGGLLIHGALAAAPENIGGGIILAGPAEVGKTTASNRLPPPWRSLSDDTTLVVRDDRGQYMAHPWPTWSRIFSVEDGRPAQGCKWDVQEGLPLKAIYFLRQAATDRIEQLPAAPALTFLMDTVQLVSSLMTWDLSAKRMQALHESQFLAVEELLRATPAYALHLSLTGAFWKNIEETLNPDAQSSPLQRGRLPAGRTISRQKQYPAYPLPDNKRITVCYTGSSMHPTFCNQDILEVIPYAGKPVRQGDIAYYPSPIDSQNVIHRAVRVTTNGILTRGDNNPAADPYIVLEKDIIGRVAAVWRNGRYRQVAAGIEGRWSGCQARAHGLLRKIFSPVLHGLYHDLSASGLLRFLLPASLRPRVFEFRQQYGPSILKLIVNGRIIGRYDAWKKIWEIDRPWRLMIDGSQLPVVTWSPALDQPSLDHADPEKTMLE